MLILSVALVAGLNVTSKNRFRGTTMRLFTGRGGDRKWHARQGDIGYVRPHGISTLCIGVQSILSQQSRTPGVIHFAKERRGERGGSPDRSGKELGYRYRDYRTTSKHGKDANPLRRTHCRGIVTEGEAADHILNKYGRRNVCCTLAIEKPASRGTRPSIRSPPRNCCVLHKGRFYRAVNEPGFARIRATSVSDLTERQLENQ
ncbi:uncharacterized protein LOC143144921 [Ptiloglossa arizonensis]|uniref:uncharacterized protein LOC143144921 n=1 Tax=Ptiloglossa arizonensis TaxID=3350558 RepID=UPI003FA0A7B0